MIPFDAAVLIVLMASFKVFPISSLLSPAIMASAFLVWVFMLARTDWPRSLLFSSWRAFFIAERFFLGADLAANVCPPCDGLVKSSYTALRCVLAYELFTRPSILSIDCYDLYF